MTNINVRFQLTERARQLRDEHRIDATPVRKTAGAACYDVIAVEPTPITVGKPTLVPCGIILEIPYGYEGIMRSRSGYAKAGKLLAWGTIDADFRGEVQACLYSAAGPYMVAPGERIAQLAIRPIPEVHFVEVPEGEQLEETARGSKGWGSTGTKG